MKQANAIHINTHLINMSTKYLKTTNSVSYQKSENIEQKTKALSLRHLGRIQNHYS